MVKSQFGKFELWKISSLDWQFFQTHEKQTRRLDEQQQQQSLTVNLNEGNDEQTKNTRVELEFIMIKGKKIM